MWLIQSSDVRSYSDLHTFGLVEWRAAVGVGDERWSGQRVRAVELHAV